MNTVACCVFARDCGHHGKRAGSLGRTPEVGRTVLSESLRTTSWLGVFLKMTKTKNWSFLNDGGLFSGQGLTRDEWKTHLLLQGANGKPTAKMRVFSDSVFCTGPGASNPISASKETGKRSCKNRNNITSQSKNLNGTCLGDTCVEILQKLRAFM